MIARSSTIACAKTSRSEGVIFVDTDTAVREYPDLVQEYVRHGDPA